MKLNKNIKEKITKFVLYSLPCCKVCQCENGKRMHCACHKKQLYDFISQTRQEVIEEIYTSGMIADGMYDPRRVVAYVDHLHRKLLEDLNKL